ncbi:A/G-specific adenine glycosylase [Falsarthrobacter nasiphocae]|uniref:Adenine DNA glycosylase n=1 Tax=Falsarthrobacter nasiphocae TaxID=189863 RepID=A0AAE4C6Y8_9MICC|nr:A/G-specific adenine glycosylase [Falsarthrobacter nasiphocae]MDR6891954.1 A/G-specific adenine glycosylase [Falsarthrobacter nasiphocae]
MTPTAARLDSFHRRLLDWFDDHERDLPWRHDGTTAWGVFVSEVMSQQTPVARVAPIWAEWMTRWPRPADLASVPEAEAVRAWGRLGYPRRARRLHAAAVAMVEDHAGEVPDTEEELLTLPGVGQYTAAAVAAFTFGRQAVVVDTNIRRVHARWETGHALPEPSLTRREMALAAELLPSEESGLSPRYNAAVMELGALVCTARSPRCGDCPLLDDCAWIAAGRPEPHYTPKGQPWAGTKRQIRGAIVGHLREREDGDARTTTIQAVVGSVQPSPEPSRVEECLEDLIREGMVTQDGDRVTL